MQPAENLYLGKSKKWEKERRVPRKNSQETWRWKTSWLKILVWKKSNFLEIGNGRITYEENSRGNQLTQFESHAPHPLNQERPRDEKYSQTHMTHTLYIYIHTWHIHIYIHLTYIHTWHIHICTHMTYTWAKLTRGQSRFLMWQQLWKRIVILPSA